MKNSRYSPFLSPDPDIHPFYLHLPLSFFTNTLIVSDAFLQAVLSLGSISSSAVMLFGPRAIPALISEKAGADS
jgi:hypothetical protein